MSDDCLFCRIVRGDIPSEKVLETEHVLAFRDISPKAPTHVLVIPKRHIASLNEVQEGDAETLGRLLTAARAVAEAEGIAGSGWRAVTNVGEGGGQTVFHVHVHVMGGRALTWPPG